MTYIFNRVRFRAFVSDEETDFVVPTPVVPVGPPPPNPFTWTLDPAQLFPAEHVAPNFNWWTFQSPSIGGIIGADAIPTDAWAHMSYTVTIGTFDSGTSTFPFDEVVVMNGVTTLTASTPASESFMGQLPIGAVYGFDNNDGGQFFLDDISINGTLIDDFEGADLSLWDVFGGAVSLSTLQAHGGTQSLLCDWDRVTFMGYVGKAVSPAVGVPWNTDFWVYYPAATLADGSGFAVNVVELVY